MLRLLGLVISVGLADSLNPSTIGPALYLATASRGRRHVAHFTAAVFLVYLVGGALIAIGPGQLLVSLLPNLHRQVRQIIEICVGAALLLGAGMLWRRRQPLAGRDLPRAPTRGRHSALLGLSITAVELPTAFPYFAVLAALIGSGLRPGSQLVLLVVFNVCFVLPLLGILAVLTLAGERSTRLLIRARDFLNVRWPHALSVLLGLAGAFVLLLGASGLGSNGRGDLNSLARGVHRVLHLQHP